LIKYHLQEVAQLAGTTHNKVEVTSSNLPYPFYADMYKKKKKKKTLTLHSKSFDKIISEVTRLQVINIYIQYNIQYLPMTSRYANQYVGSNILLPKTHPP
jgi:hypothetical protein